MSENVLTWRVNCHRNSISSIASSTSRCSSSSDDSDTGDTGISFVDGIMCPLPPVSDLVKGRENPRETVRISLQHAQRFVRGDVYDDVLTHAALGLDSRLFLFECCTYKYYDPENRPCVFRCFYKKQNREHYFMSPKNTSFSCHQDVIDVKCLKMEQQKILGGVTEDNRQFWFQEVTNADGSMSLQWLGNISYCLSLEERDRVTLRKKSKVTPNFQLCIQSQRDCVSPRTFIVNAIRKWLSRLNVFAMSSGNRTVA